MRSVINDVTGQNVVVTGGNRGIGREIALTFARAGARVAICGRDADALADTEREIAEGGGESVALRCDVSAPSEVDRLASDVLDRFGSIDVVVANAGGRGPTKPLHEVSYDEWRECLASNLDGTFLTFRAFAPAMIEQRSGCLVALSSIGGKRPNEGRSVYNAAKIAVIGLVRTVALELGPYGIRVNSICPGGVDGERFQGTIQRLAELSGRDEREILEEFAEAAPLRRLVSAADIANVCLFLATSAAAAITGEDLNVSNGLVMY